jgi:branched-chain amino acid transport system permease protein
MGYINNATFNYDMCMMSLVVVILGGVGLIKGAIIGAIIISPLGELLRGLTSVMKSLPAWMQISKPEQWRFVVYGAIMVLMMRFRPQGILGGQSKLPYKMPKGIVRKGMK